MERQKVQQHTKMHLFHISDLHFGDPSPAFDARELAAAVALTFEGLPLTQTYLVVSGDITFKGRPEGYGKARHFFDPLTAAGLPRSNILFCPGNHDICSTSFDAFDRFVYGVRRDKLLVFGQGDPVQVLENGDLSFVCINSAYHYDHTYGLIDVQALKLALSQLRGQHRLAVVHHHVINALANDSSAIRNAANLLHLLESAGVELLLHGHQHMLFNLVFGKRQCRIHSARSLNFSTTGFVNGMNRYDLGESGWLAFAGTYSKDNDPIKPTFAWQEVK